MLLLGSAAAAAFCCRVVVNGCGCRAVYLLAVVACSHWSPVYYYFLNYFSRAIIGPQPLFSIVLAMLETACAGCLCSDTFAERIVIDEFVLSKRWREWKSQFPCVARAAFTYEEIAKTLRIEHWVKQGSDFVKLSLAYNRDGKCIWTDEHIHKLFAARILIRPRSGWLSGRVIRMETRFVLLPFWRPRHTSTHVHLVCDWNGINSLKLWIMVCVCVCDLVSIPWAIQTA